VGFVVGGHQLRRGAFQVGHAYIQLAKGRAGFAEVAHRVVAQQNAANFVSRRQQSFQPCQ
jgi:hypothetical protein